MHLLDKKKVPLAARRVIATLLALAAALASRQGQAAPLEVYGRLPTLENVALSPDGSRLALIRTTADNRFLMVHSLADHKLIGKILRVGAIKLRSIQWADDDHLLIFSSRTDMPIGLIGPAHEWYLMSVWDVAKQKLSSYPDLGKARGERIMNALSDGVMVRRLEGHTVLFIPGIYVSDLTLPALFRVDLDTGTQRLMRQGSLQTESWLVDETGEVAAEEDYDQPQQHWRMLDRHDGRLQEIASGHEPIDIPRLLGFGPDPGTLLVQTKENGDPIWRLLAVKDGTFGPRHGGAGHAGKLRSRTRRPIA